MGCACQIMVLGGSDELPQLGENRVRQLEESWTRFDSDSELADFNARTGSWTRVSADLLELLWRGLAGWRLSQGMFNPFLGTEIVSAGYDRDFSQLSPPPALPVADADATSPENHAAGGARWYSRRGHGPAPLVVNRSSRMALLSTGFEFDSGGIGKGLGADIVATALVSAGATGAMVSLGGDVRVAGGWPDEGWRIGIVDPFAQEGDTAGTDQGLSVVLRDGALCTSGTLKRRWKRDDGSISHHILNPRTGTSLAPEDVAAVTAIARQGWRAEVLTKMVLVGGSSQARHLHSRSPQTAFLLWDHTATMSAVQ